MSNPSQGPVLIIVTPSGSIAQRVDDLTHVELIVKSLKVVMEPDHFAACKWRIDPDSNVRDARAA